MNQNKDYDRNDRVTEEELKALKLKVCPRRGLIIIGIIFILLELTDGSAIFFLPLGIGSLILSLYIYLCNIELISESLILETWYFALVVWAILSLITSILISLARKRY